MTRGKTFIVSGPSGVGKSTVLKALMEKRKNLYFSISATTRAPRPGEVHGVHYHFITRESFAQLIREERLLEHAEYVGNFYGTPLDPVLEHLAQGDDVILEIEIQGAKQVKARYPEAALVFICLLYTSPRPGNGDRGDHPPPHGHRPAGMRPYGRLSVYRPERHAGKRRL